MIWLMLIKYNWTAIVLCLSLFLCFLYGLNCSLSFCMTFTIPFTLNHLFPSCIFLITDTFDYDNNKRGLIVMTLSQVYWLPGNSIQIQLTLDIPAVFAKCLQNP